jgi:hypothetical protein
MSLPLPLFVPLLSPFVFFNPLKMAMLVDINALKAQFKNVKIYQELDKWIAVFVLILSFAFIRLKYVKVESIYTMPKLKLSR